MQRSTILAVVAAFFACMNCNANELKDDDTVSVSISQGLDRNKEKVPWQFAFHTVRPDRSGETVARTTIVTDKKNRIIEVKTQQADDLGKHESSFSIVDKTRKEGRYRVTVLFGTGFEPEDRKYSHQLMQEISIDKNGMLLSD
jgi:hypothetical protein